MNDIEPDSDYSDDEEEDGAGAGGEASLSFEQYDVILPKARLESFNIAIMSERGPFTDDIPQFIECSFHEKEMLGKGICIYLAIYLCLYVEFLACVHLHTDEGDLAEISKTKTIRMVPLLCGLASRCSETNTMNSTDFHMFPGTRRRARELCQRS